MKSSEKSASSRALATCGAFMKIYVNMKAFEELDVLEHVVRVEVVREVVDHVEAVVEDRGR